jgi:hypothetical protein
MTTRSDLDSGTDIVVVCRDATETGINALLANASKISGTVTGSDGTTLLQDIQATAYRWNDSVAYWEWMQLRSYTDDNGEYTIGSLPAGTYRVQFGDWNGDYLSEFYDNAPDLDSGTDIVVPAETTVTGIDASLANASKISGTVTGPDGTTPPARHCRRMAYTAGTIPERIGNGWAMGRDRRQRRVHHRRSGRRNLSCPVQ